MKISILNFLRPALIILVVLLSFLQPLFSQQKGKIIPITGTIIDEVSGEPLIYATISLFQNSDSSMVTGGITDEQGRFNLEAKRGNYYAILEFLGYQSKTIDGITVGKAVRELQLGQIQLGVNTQVLAEVEVRAEQSEVQMALDKRVFNVGKDLANAGGNAADILDNVPSVAVDVEGNVSLRGSGGVRLLVDGRPSGMIGTDVAQGLRSIPAEMIEKVEVITNPSARYEAEGAAGIINIVLKKERRGGVNGSFQATAGHPDSYGVGLNLNWRRTKFNYFTNLNLNYRENPGQGTLFQRLTRMDSNGMQTVEFSDQRREHLRSRLSPNIQFGADYFLDKKNTITGSFLYRLRYGDNFSTIRYEDFLNSKNNPTGLTTRTDDESEDGYNLEGALTYRREFDKKGQELIFDVRYQDNAETEKSDLLESFFNSDGSTSGQANLVQNSNNEENSSQWVAQLDYVHPISKEGKFEIGARTSIREINNDFYVEEFLGGEWQKLPGLSNEFTYEENIYAAYVLLGDKKDRISYQLGLRAELSDVTTISVADDSTNARTYANLFPSAAFTYELADGNALQLSYSRRLRRPGFRWLNPFYSYSDSRNIYAGNPNLDPEFTHSLELGHIKYWDKASVSSALFYRHTTGLIERIREVDDIGNSVSQPQNLAIQDAYGAEFTYSYRPTKSIKINGDFNIYYALTDAGKGNEYLDAEAFTGNGRLTAMITLWKKLDTQWRLNYRAPRNNPQGKYKSITSLDVGISYPVLKEKGTLTLSLRDAFNSRKRRWITEGTDPDFYNEGSFQWRARSIQMTFSYRINKAVRRKGVENKSSAEYGGEDI